MIEDFFDHTCDIYHLNKGGRHLGYGLPDEDTYTYNDTPDIEAQVCHFGIKTGNMTVIQQEPQQDLDARIKLTFPVGTDVRLNDKIISRVTGYEYLAEVPRNVRGHHIYVYVRRTTLMEHL